MSGGVKTVIYIPSERGVWFIKRPSVIDPKDIKLN